MGTSVNMLTLKDLQPYQPFTANASNNGHYAGLIALDLYCKRYDTRPQCGHHAAL